MLKETHLRATHLYLDIAKHYQKTGQGLTIRDINKLLGFSSTATPRYYLKILLRWGLVKQTPKGVRTIIPLVLENYPPVEYRRSEHATN